MKIVLAGGQEIDLGTVEATPTIGIIDYSRRVTDDFGVTTVVERGFARSLSVKLAMPADRADMAQRQLADLRATPATWMADERFAWLKPTGFYKDFSLDLPAGALSYCTLTVEGLAETETVSDPGGDPAPDGAASTLELLQPATFTDAMLVASSVAEDDAPTWSASATYPKGAKVVRAHRVWESLGAPAGNDPAATTGGWIDLAPTNRWAALDQALGTVMTAASPITMTLRVPGATALGLLDVTGATVRVQAAGYDQTQPVTAGALIFRGLPGTDATVTIAGAGQVAAGTLLIGHIVALGITEASPTAGITDYSRKVVDDFGEVTVVQRAFAKKMSARALIRTDALDIVADRIASIRATPSLWIGGGGRDSLNVYGFFSDFSIEVGQYVSKLSLNVQGISAAAKLEPIKGVVNWPDVIDSDPTRPKPQDGATIGAPGNTPIGGVVQPDGSVIGGKTASQVVDELDELFENGGGDAGAGASAEAAAAARDAAIVARDQTYGARDAAQAKALAAAESATSANGYAITASGQASIATQKADDAGEKASLASGKADIASTKAGEASLSAGEALTSERNAAGSAVSAAQFQELTATTAQDAASATLTAMRSPGAAPSLWTWDAFNVLKPTSANLRTAAADPLSAFSFPAGNLRVSGGAGVHIHSYAVAAVDPARWQRAVVRFRIVKDGSQPNTHPLYVTFWDKAGNLLLGNTVLVGVLPGDRTVEMGVQEIAVEFRPIGYSPDVGFIRAMYRTATGTHDVEVLQLYIEDVEASRQAADSATATVTSAATASAKATEAGQSATAAQQDRVAAQAANGAAQGAASAAQSSAATAGAQAAAATSVVSVAAQFSTQALNRNPVLSQWPDGAELPAYWERWREATFVQRIAGVAGPYAWLSNSDGGEQGIMTSWQVDAGLGGLPASSWYVIEADITLHAGQFGGAGVHINFYNAEGNATGPGGYIDFETDPSNGPRNPLGSPGTRYRFTKLVQEPRGDGVNIWLYAMPRWGGFPSPARNAIIAWHQISVRPATRADLEARQGVLDAATTAARVEQVASAAASDTSALATRVSGTEARAGSLESRTSISEQSIATLDGKTASRLQLAAISPAGRAELQIVSSAGYTGFDFTGDVNFRGRVIHDTGTFMKVSGIGFGTRNQFLEWFGPSKGNIAQCDESDAITYERVDGFAYHGGGLAAGTIVNPVQTTLTGPTLSVTTNQFRSNGRRRVVTVSYSFDFTVSNSGTCPANPGPTSALIRLFRGTDASGPLLQQMAVNGSYFCERGRPNEPGFISEGMSASFTYNDDTGGTSASFYADMVNRASNTTPQRQGLSLISVEQ